MQFKDILYEVKGDYAHVTINRPKVLNAFTPVTLQELKASLDAAEKDKEVGVIVLSGAGDRAFCSGGDMNWESSKEFQDHEYEFHIHLTKCSKPIIAKVDGYAIGGGNHMAYFCDLTIASENSIFGQNGPRVGSPAGDPTLGPFCPNIEFSLAIVRSQKYAIWFPPPIAYPSTFAIIGLLHFVK